MTSAICMQRNKQISNGAKDLACAVMTLIGEGAHIQFAWVGVGDCERPLITLQPSRYTTRMRKLKRAEIVQKLNDQRGQVSVFRLVVEGCDVEWSEPEQKVGQA